MANQYTKNKVPQQDPNFPHVAVGLSNEELLQKQMELDAKKQRGEYFGVEITADAHDKKTDGWGDLEFDPLGLTDPLAQLKKTFEKPGMALKLLSTDINDRIGTRGYKIVKDENGDPVRSGKMVLGEIPQRFVDARRKAVKAATQEQLDGIKDAQDQAIRNLQSEAAGLGLQVLGEGEKIYDSRSKRTADAGITVERGEQS